MAKRKKTETQQYCIYTDRYVDAADYNLDHIIPRSLGGHDEFCVWSEKNFNSKIGSQVDGKLANDPLLMLARRNADARGHSNKKPIPIWKKSKIDGDIVQVILDTEKVSAFDVKSGNTKEIADGTSIQTELKLDIYSSIPFVAKVVLAGGYFVYGEKFKTAINCDDLRALIELDLGKARQDPKYLKTDIGICDRFGINPLPNDQKMYSFMCQMEMQSTLICVPHEDAISFHVGILGGYMGSLFCPGVAKDFPTGVDDLEHDLGHALLMGPNHFERTSLRTLAMKANEIIKQIQSNQ